MPEINSNIEIKVAPDVLDQKASDVTRLITEIETLFTNIQDKVDRTKSYWIGEAGDAHRQAFADEKDDIAQILKRLKEHPTDLQMMANTYRMTEQAVEEQNAALNTDWIL